MLSHRNLSPAAPPWAIALVLLALLPVLPPSAHHLPPARAAQTTVERLTTTGGPIGGVVISGDYVFLGEGRLLSVLSLSGGALKRVASVELPTAASLLVQDAHLLYAAGGGQLHVIDVSNPGRPDLLGTPLNQQICQLDVQDAIAFTVVPGQAGDCATNTRAEIVDMRDRSHPLLLASLAGLYQIQVQGSYAYALTAQNSLRILDVGNLRAPATVSDTPLQTYAHAPELSVSGSNVYIASVQDQKFVIYDASDPVKPRERYAADYSCANENKICIDAPYFEALIDGVRYVTSQYGFNSGATYLNATDLSDPDHPVELFKMVSSPPNTMVPYAGAQSKLLAREGVRGHLILLNLNSPMQPQLLGRSAAPVGTDPFAVERRRLVTNHYADVLRYHHIAGQNTLVEFDFGRPQPLMTHEQTTGSYEKVTITSMIIDAGQVYSSIRPAIDLARAGGTTYSITEDTLSIDGQTATLPISGFNGVAAHAGVVYLTNGDLVLVDAHDPANPSVISTLVTPGEAQGVAVEDSIAYVADGASGLLMVDVSNPQAPLMMGPSTAVPLAAEKIRVSGHRIYLSSAAEGVSLLWYGPPQTIPISADGGTFEDRASGVSLSFAPGSSPISTTVTYTPRPVESLPGAYPLINGDVAYELAGTAPTAPYSVTIHYDAWGLDATPEARLALYRWDGTQWAREPSSTLDTASKTISAYPTAFGLWAVIGEPLRVYLPEAGR